MGLWRLHVGEVCFSSQMKGLDYRLFKASKGLEKGDPLFPFLFTCVVEAVMVLNSYKA